MGTDQIMYCIVALILGMLLANMLKNVCGCKVVEGTELDKAHNIANSSCVTIYGRPNIRCNINTAFDQVTSNPHCSEVIGGNIVEDSTGYNCIY